MSAALFTTDSTLEYGLHEAGPIVIALGFVIALGGVTAAAIVICGWGRVKSAGINWSRWTAEIVCR